MITTFFHMETDAFTVLERVFVKISTAATNDKPPVDVFRKPKDVVCPSDHIFIDSPELL